MLVVAQQLERLPVKEKAASANLVYHPRGFNSVDRVSTLHVESRRFDSCKLHHFLLICVIIRRMNKIEGGSQYLKNGKSHYERNKGYYYSRVEARRQINREFISAIKKKGRCVDCGIKDTRVLDFDHRAEFKKIKAISNAVLNGWSLKKLQEEINKCELRCANCHRIKTYERYADIS